MDCLWVSHRCSLTTDPDGGIIAQVSRARHAWGAGQSDAGNSQQSAPQRR